MIIDGKKTARVQRDFECSVSTLFEHWKPQNMIQWWKELTRIEMPSVVGDAVLFEFEGFDGQLKGRVEEFVENQLWSFTWEHLPGKNLSYCRCEFQSTDRGSRLIITNSKAASFDEAAGYDHGWQYCLEALDRVINKEERDKEITLTRTFNAPIKMVFEAWSKPEHMSFWMNGAVNPEAVCRADVKKGGDFRLDHIDKDGLVHCHYGIYKEVDPPNRLVFTWLSDHSEGETEVTVDLKEVGGQTVLTLTHRLFRSEECAAEHREGWESLWVEMEKILAR